MEEKNVQKGVKLKDIFIGKVSIIKEYDKNEVIPEGTIIGDNGNRRIVSLRVRKIVFCQNEEKMGTDLSYKLTKNDTYSYRVINTKDDVFGIKNNTIVIERAQPIGDMLEFIGYPSVVRKKEIKEIKKLILSDKTIINIRKHSIALKGEEAYDIEQIKKVNDQLENLYGFKLTPLFIRPLAEEKAYIKYFKKM